MNKNFDDLIFDSLPESVKNNPIVIVSGEGEMGFSELYAGKRTSRAIKARLTRERAKRDRWARAKLYMHENIAGQVFLCLHTGQETSGHLPY